MTAAAHRLFTAPAARLLTVLHRPDPADPGRTVCGVVMLAEDLWQLVSRLPGDRVCPGCDGSPVAEAVLF